MKARLLLFILVAMSGCWHREKVERHLSLASRYMRTRPDSSLRIMESLDRESILSRDTRARYALLYSRALERNSVAVDNDSLIGEAYRYYRHRMCSDSVRFLLNYLYGRVRQNGGNLQSAMKHYLAAERYARATGKNYYLGWVYTRMGEVYAEQMNYNTMLEYCMEAYEYFGKLDDPACKNKALLDIANAYSYLNDPQRARRYYQDALALAKRRQDRKTMSACLGNIGVIDIQQENYRAALRAVRKIRTLTPEAVSLPEYELLAEAHCGLGRMDSARHYLDTAWTAARNLRDSATLTYLSYRIESATGNREKAREEIDRYIELNDSLSRLMLYQSAADAERRYYREEYAFARYRLKTRIRLEILIAALTGTLLLLTLYIYRQRIRSKQAEIDRYMSAVDNFRRTENRLVAQMEQAKGLETKLKELALSRFSMIDKFGRAFYERDNTQKQQEMIFRQVKDYMARLSKDPATKKNLEKIVNTISDDAVAKLREQFPKFKPSDIDLLCYIYAGFSPQIISLLMNDSVQNVYARKSRLKARIAVSAAADKEKFLSLM